MSPRHYDVENFWNFRLEDLQFLLKQCLERGQHLKILGLQLRHSIHAIRDETRVDWCCDLAPRMLIINSPHNPTGGATKRSRCITVSGLCLVSWLTLTHRLFYRVLRRRSVLHSGGAGPDLWIAGRVWRDAHPVFRWDTRLYYAGYIMVYLYILYVWHVEIFQHMS